MAYADYEYYTQKYLGEAITAADFPRLAERASEYLDYVTLGRAADTAVVKRACCAVAEAISTNEHGGGIASETNDGVSVNYVAGVSNTKTEDQRLYEAARRALAHTGLLYVGVG